MINSWEELGLRVKEARASLGMTQVALAEGMEVDRTVVSKIEAGSRTVDTLELVKLAQVLQRPLSWFLQDPLPAVVSRRAHVGTPAKSSAWDRLLEELAQDVEQLIELECLQPPEPRAWPLPSIDDAERVAREVRAAAGLSEEEPAWDLVRLVERLGLYAFVLPAPAQKGSAGADGSYLSLQRGGVALINAAHDSGRRRFTLAHELGHHVLQDAYAPEWIIDDGATATEQAINAFAIHFLLPRAGILRRWQALKDAGPRHAAIHLGVEFGASWSALCAQLHRLQCISAAESDNLAKNLPGYAELAEQGLRIRDDLTPIPLIPPGYEAAVFRAARRAKLGRDRALELLRGAVLERDLPEPAQPPLAALAGDVKAFLR